MSFAKPEYIQNFLDEKFKKDKRTERITLLKDDFLSSEHDEHERDVASDRKTGDSRNSSNISESDDNNLPHDHLQHKQISSDADCETDDSLSLSRKSNIPSNNSFARRAHQKKSRDAKTPLCAAGSSSGYGGTSEIELDCAETLATYSHNGTPVKGILKAGANTSAEASYQSFQNGEDAPAGPSKSSGARKRKIHNHKGNAHGGHDGEEHIHEHDHDHEDHGSLGSSTPSEVESDHCHDSSDEKTQRENKKRKKAMRKLLIATGLSFLFMVGEIVGGFLANSLAIMTDASHLLTDVSSFLISIIALKMAARPISKKMTFGWHRAEVIGALISVVAIWIVTGVLVYLAVMRLINNNYEVHGKTMLITASLAVGFNILMGLVLHEHSHTHGHSHGHSHAGHSHDHNDHDHEAGSNASSHDEDSGNVNVRAAFIHVIGDLLQSLGVLTAAFVIYFKPEYKIADPICTFLFSIFVLITTITILRDTIIVIMEGSPVGVEYSVVKEKLLEIEGVTAVHDLRIWSLTLNQTVMSAHLAIDKSTDPNLVLKRATRRLKSLYDFHSLTIQVEYYSNDMDECKKCQPA
ncbi:proton-coupled zinc antiporter SLC30A2 [Ciona intestinalis]